MYAYFLYYINESLLYSKEEGAGREPVGGRRRGLEMVTYN